MSRCYPNQILILKHLLSYDVLFFLNPKTRDLNQLIYIIPEAYIIVKYRFDMIGF